MVAKPPTTKRRAVGLRQRDRHSTRVVIGDMFCAIASNNRVRRPHLRIAHKARCGFSRAKPITAKHDEVCSVVGKQQHVVCAPLGGRQRSTAGKFDYFCTKCGDVERGGSGRIRTRCANEESLIRRISSH